MRMTSELPEDDTIIPAQAELDQNRSVQAS